jgi:hypothetical protein
VVGGGAIGGVAREGSPASGAERGRGGKKVVRTMCVELELEDKRGDG